MNLNKSYASWSLFFSWGGFVFLSVNFFTGIILSKASIENFIIGNFIGFVLLALTLYPTIYISIKYKVNFSETVNKFIKINFLQKGLLILVLLINIGWYSIQLTAVWDILKIFHLNIVILLFISYLFAYGSYKFGYDWLKNFSIITLVFFILYLVVVLISGKNIISIEKVDNEYLTIWQVSLLVYGTWAFSSSTIVMDITKYTNDFKKSYFYILLATLFFNFLLIFFGYYFGRYTQINTFMDFVSILGLSIGIILFLLNIWTTNDSNFFSSMQILKNFNINKKIVFTILPLINGLLAIYYQDDLFSVIGKWLKLMSWIGIPMSLYWWLVLYFDLREVL